MSSEINDQAEDTRWFAVWTRSRQEKVAASTLGRLGISYFLPLSSETRQWSDRKQNVELPLFPGYLFVRIPKLSEFQVRVLKVPGIVGFIGNRSGPQTIPEEEIESIRTVVNLGMSCGPCQPLHVGDRVRVVRGLLTGVEGNLVRFGSQSKLLISVGIIRQSIAVSVNMSDVQLLLTASST